MTTGYVALYTVGGDGLGIASAATDVSLANRNLALGTGSLTATNLTGTLQTAAQTNVTSLGTLTSLSIAGTPNGTNVLDVQSYPASAGVVSQPSAIRVYQGSYNHPGGGTISSMYGVYISAGAGGETGDIFLGANLYVQTPLFGDRRISAAFEGNVVITSPSVSSAPTLATDLQIHSATQNSSRLTFSGQEFYQAANTSTEGPAFVLGVNRTNNRQVWLVDSANASIASTTNFMLRFNVSSTNATIDAYSTDGATAKQLNLGSSAGLYLSGNVGLGTVATSKFHIKHPSYATLGSLYIDRVPNDATHGHYGQSIGTAWYDGTNWNIPNHDGVNRAFAFIDYGYHSLHFYTAQLAGTTPTTISDATMQTYRRMFIDSSGQVTMNVGLFLPTSGGTATLLNYYEELTYSMTFTGIWAANRTIDARIVRNGKLVTISFPSCFTTANTAAFITTTAGSELPTRFRPVIYSTFFTRVFNNGAIAAGFFHISTAGAVEVNANLTGGTFTATNNGGFAGTCVSYHVF